METAIITAETGASQPTATEAAPSTVDTAATTSQAPEFWDTYEALEQTPWLAELPEDRKSYLLGGAKRKFDDYETKLAEKAAEADMFRKFVEAENPEYHADKERATKLESDVAAAKAEVVSAQAELAKLRNEGASHAAIVQQMDEIKAAKVALEQSFQSMQAEKNALTDTIAEASAEFHQMMETVTGMLFDHGVPGVSPQARGTAKQAFMAYIVDNVDEFSTSGKSIEDLTKAAWAHASTLLPKPDNVPLSVKVQGGPSQRSAEVDDQSVYSDYMAFKGDKPDDAVAKKYGITVAAVIEALGRHSDKIKSR